MPIRSFIRRGFARIAIAASVTVLAGISPAVADPVDLSQTPVVNSTSVAPNVMLTFDDSGSMASTSLPDGLYANYTNQYYYSSTTNKVYFDPSKDYPPPPKPDGSLFPNSNYVSAWGDGFCANWPSSASPSCSSPRQVNLSNAFCSGFVVDDNSGTPPTANQAGNKSAANCPPTNEGFWYECPLANSNTGCVRKTVGSDTALRQKFANWYSYYRTRNLMARTSVAMAFVQVGDKIRIAWQNFNQNKLGDSTKIATFTGTQRASFFDWLYKMPTANSTPTIESVQRVGKFFSSGYSNGKGTGTNGVYNPYWEPIASMAGGGMELACRQNYSMVVTDGYWTNTVAAPLSTPNTGTSGALPLDDSGASPVATRTYDPNKSYANVYKPKLDSSLAATAFYYWATDLRPDLKNRVPPYLADTTTGVTDTTVRALPLNPFDDDEVYFNPANDPAIWQHLVQYMVGLGVSGTLPFSDATLLGLRTGANAWPAIGTAATKADDSWHAAVNSRGDYFSAQNPQELVKALSDILNSISLRRNSSSAMSVSSSVMTAGSLAYSTGYDTSNWMGNVVAKKPLANGTLGTALWDAGCILTGGNCASTGTNAGTGRTPASRQILTSSSASGTGVPFAWGSLSNQQQVWLNQNPASGTACASPSGTTGGCDGSGSKRLDYIRGDRTQEAAGSTPQFRARTSLLGAVINSSAIYHSLPSSGYRDIFPASSPEATAAAAGNTYEKFASDNRNNRAVLYVGANDGMLHAFDANNGNELWAYVPYAVSQNLNKLTASPYKFQSFVDNSPEIQDVFTGGQWRTLLVGTLRMGGRGVYALDVTDPDAVNENTAGTRVKWEFSNYVGSSANNLGYTFGQPNIVRLRNGKWVVLVPAGYFQDPSTDNTDPTSSLPAASLKVSSLFVLDAGNGSVIAELKTPASITSYGLSTASVGSYGRDQMADFAIAGDLVGNLWRFDLTDLSTVDQIFSPATNGAQPITSMPQIFPDTATQGVIVVFGTGKYLGAKDRDIASMPTQTYYGIREFGKKASNYPAKVADLVKQTLTIDAATNNRSLTGNPVPVANKGWYFNLDKVPGERNVLRAGRLINSNRAVLTSLIPAGNDPCDPSIKGGVMIVDAASGGPPAGPPPVGGGSPLPGGSTQVVGTQVNSPPTTGAPSMMTVAGGGSVIVPGIGNLVISDAYWRRRAWRTTTDAL